jgi:hypothetical protein
VKIAAVRLCVVLAWLVAAVIAAPTSTYAYLHYTPGLQLTPWVGGGGGDALRTECDGFDYLAGVQVRYGNWIDAVGINCATPQEYKGKLSFSGPHGKILLWGGPGGGIGNDLCSIDEGVGGLRIQRSPNNYVGYLAVLCRSLTRLDRAPVPTSTGGFGRISDKSPPAQDIVCPPGMIAVGIHGATGGAVDRIGLVCAHAPEVAHEAITSGMEDNTDRPGSDYRHFPVTEPRVADCQEACRAERNSCRAWTYVRGGVQGPAPICYLKNAAPAVRASDCCISGTFKDRGTIILEAPPPVFPDRRTSDSGRFVGPRSGVAQRLAGGRCKSGFVWRVARPQDLVCVTPESRTLARNENAVAASRRDANGAYGPDTCLSGFVWREAFAGDQVCVTPERRAAVRDENAMAPARTE